MVPYPDPLKDVKNFSPELMLLWARRTILYLEIEFLEDQIKAFEEGSRNEEVSEEENKARYEQVKKSLEMAIEEKDIVISSFNDV